jgi:hypothetical protein
MAFILPMGAVVRAATQTVPPALKMPSPERRPWREKKSPTAREQLKIIINAIDAKAAPRWSPRY